MMMVRRGSVQSVVRLLLVGYAVMILLLAITWGTGSYTTGLVQDHMNNLVGVNASLVENIHVRVELMDDEETGLRGYLLTGRKQFLQPYLAARRRLQGERVAANILGHRLPRIMGPLARMSDRGSAWERWARMMLRRPPTNPRAPTAIAMQVVGKRLFDRYRAASNRVTGLIRADGSRESRQARHIARAMNRVSAAIFLIAVGITASIGWLTARAIAHPLARLVALADAIGDGRFTQPVKVEGAREFGELTRHMDRMRRRLAEEADRRRKAEQELHREAVRRSAASRAQQEVFIADADVDTVMRTIVEQTRVLYRADAAVVEVVEGNEMVYRAASGSASSLVGLRLSRAGSLSGLCAAGTQILRCDDSEVDSRVDREVCRKVGARSMILVPLSRATRMVGVLKIVSSQPGHFSDEDAASLELVSGVLGAALARAEAFDALRASEANLHAKTREQDAFLHTVSHDLRSPLVSMQGLINILVEDHGPDLGPEALYLLERVNVNADRMQGLLGDLLDLSRIGRIEMELGPVDLDTVLGGVVDQLRPALDARNAHLRILGDLPAVHGNATRLAQLFTNLIQNAVLYTPAGRTPVIRIAADELGEAWVLRVSDNGIGIAEEARAKILGLFQRLPEGKALNPGGTGVGLAIVARVVETHGGRLEIDSIPGEGTTFRCIIPRPATPSLVPGSGEQMERIYNSDSPTQEVA